MSNEWVKSKVTKSISNNQQFTCKKLMPTYDVQVQRWWQHRARAKPETAGSRNFDRQYNVRSAVYNITVNI